MPNVANFKILGGAYSYKYATGTEQVRDIAKFIKHPRYGTRASVGFDISVVELTQPFVLNIYVKPIRHPISSISTGSAIATGWGLTIDGYNDSIPEFLQVVTLGMMSYADCKQKWGRLPENVICAAAPGKDTCQGDSGGPLVYNENGQMVQVGIVSYGAECASAWYPGVYTAVASYKTFIAQSLKKL